jgi:hypothetical protein
MNIGVVDDAPEAFDLEATISATDRTAYTVFLIK